MRHRGPHFGFLSVLIACCGLLTTPLHAAAVLVKDVRLWAGPDSTRVVFDLSGPVEHSLLILQDPARVVVDLADAKVPNVALELPEGRGFAKQLRVGSQGAKDLRVVIDLSGPAVPKSFAVEPNGPYGHRLVVDLMPGSVAVANAPIAVKSAATDSGRDIVVAIDAGHGGQDPGSIGKRGTFEKHVTLQIARRLKEVIDREPGMRAELTREGDYFLPHRERMLRARRKQADMFISIHADAFHDRSVVGSSVYTLSARGASDESARWLADRENAADLVGGVSLDDKDAVLASVLLDLSQSASMSASVDAAGKVLSRLVGLGNTTNRGVKHAGFLVLKSPDIPSILVETAFISNPGEESRLLDPKHQTRLAQAIHAGVRDFFWDNPPPGTRFAQLRFKQDGSTVIASAGGSSDHDSAGAGASRKARSAILRPAFPAGRIDADQSSSRAAHSPDRRRRGHRATSIRHQGVGGEQYRRRRAAHRHRYRRRRRAPVSRARRRFRHSTRRAGSRVVATRDQQDHDDRRSGTRRHTRISRRGAAKHRFGVTYAPRVTNQ